MGLKHKKNNFPVSECVTNCFIKKVQYKTGQREDDTSWEAIVFSIVNGDDWTNLYLKNPIQKKFESDTKFQNKKYQMQVALERIISLYIDSNGMLKFRDGLVDIDRNFESYCNYVIKILEKANYKDVMVDVKTVPTEKEEARILPYGVFIRKSGDLSRVLQYSDWEKDLIENLYNKKS